MATISGENTQRVQNQASQSWRSLVARFKNANLNDPYTKQPSIKNHHARVGSALVHLNSSTRQLANGKFNPK